MRWPRPKSLMKLKDRVRAKTSRLDGRSLDEIVADVNRTLRGWYGYFQHSKGNVFATVDGFVQATLAEPAAMAVGWAGQRHRSGPSPLAE